MDPLRRCFLGFAGGSVPVASLVSAGLLKPGLVVADEWNRRAFTANKLADSLKLYGTADSTENRSITINAPEIAENGAQVPVEIISSIPGSLTLAVFIEKNPMPLAASLRFSNGALPQVRLQLKMAESSRVRVVIKAADGKIYHASREIRVTIGGCVG